MRTKSAMKLYDMSTTVEDTAIKNFDVKIHISYRNNYETVMISNFGTLCRVHTPHSLTA